jgi:hypothetical protein
VGLPLFPWGDAQTGRGERQRVTSIARLESRGAARARTTSKLGETRPASWVTIVSIASISRLGGRGVPRFLFENSGASRVRRAWEPGCQGAAGLRCTVTQRSRWCAGDRAGWKCVRRFAGVGAPWLTGCHCSDNAKPEMAGGRRPAAEADPETSVPLRGPGWLRKLIRSTTLCTRGSSTCGMKNTIGIPSGTTLSGMLTSHLSTE